MELKEDVVLDKNNLNSRLARLFSVRIEDIVNTDSDLGKNLYYKERADREILKVYEKNGRNFQRELIDNVNDSNFIDDLKEELLKTKEQKKSERTRDESKQKVDKKVKELQKEGLDIDNAEEENIIDDINNGEIELTDEEIEKAVIKAAYSKVYDEYSKYRQNLYYGQNGQVVNGDLDVGYKQGMKIVLYENHLRKLDLGYRAKYGVFIAQDHEDIAKKENEHSYKSAKAEKSINYKVDQGLDRITILNDEIESIIEEMSNLSDKAENTKSDSFKDKMDKLQSEYIDKTCELTELKPSALELHEQVENYDEQELFKERVMGKNYDKKHNRAVINTKTLNKNRGNNKFKDELADQTIDEVHGNMDYSLDEAEQILKTADELITGNPTRDDLTKATELTESAKAIVGISGEIKFDEQKENLTEQNKEISKDDDELESQKEKSDFVKYCEGAVRSEEEILEIDVKRLKEEIKLTREEITKKRESISNIR